LKKVHVHLTIFQIVVDIIAAGGQSARRFNSDRGVRVMGKECGNAGRGAGESESSATAYRHSVSGVIIPYFYLPGGFALAYGLLAASGVGLAVAAAGAAVMLATFAGDSHEYKNFVAGRQAETKTAAEIGTGHERRAAEATSVRAFKPGDGMADGTVYAGISPDTHNPMYTTTADARLTYTFNEARKYAEKLDGNGRRDWRVPTKGELNVMFQNRAAIGGFHETLFGLAGWYWSSTEDTDGYAWDQRLRDGYQGWDGKGVASSLRCVRG
jgi:Protein of unknown function (DUF1566)